MADPALPPSIDPRAAQAAIIAIERHNEGATGSHMHWLFREASRLMHREFAVAQREEALLQQSDHGKGRGHNGRRRGRTAQQNNGGAVTTPPTAAHGEYDTGGPANGCAPDVQP